MLWLLLLVQQHNFMRMEAKLEEMKSAELEDELAALQAEMDL